jgi:hypothetical protein
MRSRFSSLGRRFIVGAALASLTYGAPAYAIVLPEEGAKLTLEVPDEGVCVVHPSEHTKKAACADVDTEARRSLLAKHPDVEFLSVFVVRRSEQIAVAFVETERDDGVSAAAGHAQKVAETFCNDVQGKTVGEPRFERPDLAEHRGLEVWCTKEKPTAGLRHYRWLVVFDADLPSKRTMHVIGLTTDGSPEDLAKLAKELRPTLRWSAAEKKTQSEAPGFFRLLGNLAGFGLVIGLGVWLIARALKPKPARPAVGVAPPMGPYGGHPGHGYPGHYGPQSYGPQGYGPQGYGPQGQGAQSGYPLEPRP